MVTTRQSSSHGRTTHLPIDTVLPLVSHNGTVPTAGEGPVVVVPRREDGWVGSIRLAIAVAIDSGRVLVDCGSARPSPPPTPSPPRPP